MSATVSEPRPSLAGIVAVMEHHYPPSLAQSWDAVGLVCGDPARPVARVLFAVDPTDAVVDEALEWNADLIVAHHPLLLRAVNSVAMTTNKGSRLHRLIRAECALLTAHTNADSANPGVSDALADALGVVGLRPLAADLDYRVPETYKLTVFVPLEQVDVVVEELSAAGAGRVGAYDHCAYVVEGTGQFRPLPGASPAVGTVGATERVSEGRVEMVLDASVRREVESALLAVHPYEQPAYDFVRVESARPGASIPGVGLGRVGRLPEPMRLGEFTRQVAETLPRTAAGVRVAGDEELLVTTVALCGGAGDSLLDAARSQGADVYVTSDLRHHRLEEHLAAGGCAVIDVAHWASEWPWLSQARDVVHYGAKDLGASVETRISVLVTDPWSRHES